MNDLLRTRLFVPAPRPGTVVRERVLARLNPGKRLTVVSAPAGFGKTTLIAHWLQELDDTYSIAWLSLDSDDTPARFLAYLMAALQQLDPAIGRDLPLGSQVENVTELRDFLNGLLNDLAAWGRPFLLVLDDWHLVPDPLLNDALAHFIEHLPPAGHLVLLSRSDPPFSLSRRRARGELTELRAADLRFTPDEALAFYRQTMGLDLAPEEAAALDARAEGWIAGLQLAGLSLQRAADRTAFLDDFTGSHRFILDYLADEVLDHQPPELHDFLLRTALPERFCAGLAAALLDDPGNVNRAASLMERLEQGNIFLVPLDHRRQWFRYHHLFGELLRRRLRRLRSGEIPALHRRAAAWLAERELAREAVGHAMAIPDWPLAADLVLRFARSLFARADVGTVQQWFDRLPAGIIATRPRLALLRAWAMLYGGNISPLPARLEEIERAAAQSKLDVSGEVAALDGVRQTVQARDTAGVAAARYRLEEARTDLGDDPLLHCVVLANLGLLHAVEGNLARARRRLEEAEATARGSGNVAVRLTALTTLANLDLLAGRLRRAEQRAAEALVLAGENRPVPPAAALALVRMADIRYQQNRLEEAERLLQRGLPAMDRMGLSANVDRAFLTLARVRRAHGAADEALAALDEGEGRMDKLGLSAFAGTLWAYRVRLLLEQGRPEDARRAFARLEAAKLRRGSAWDAAARLALAQEQPRKALTILEEAAARFDRPESRGRRMRVDLLRALALEAAGERAAALETLRPVVRWGMEEGFLRLFLDEGPPLRDLARHLSPSAARERLLSAFGPEPAPPAAGLLTERELEVLALAARGKTNREIADALVIAVGTAQRHLANIYAKLEVGNRTEAAARARELGYL